LGPPVDELFGTPKCGDAGCTIADCVIWSLSGKRFATIVGPELARWCTGDCVHDCDVMDRLLLLFATWAAADDGVVLEWSVICVFGRFELVYDECRDGDDVAEAGDEGRNIAKNKIFIINIFFKCY